MKKLKIVYVIIRLLLFPTVITILFADSALCDMNGNSKRERVYFGPYSFYPDAEGNSLYLPGKEKLYALFNKVSVDTGPSHTEISRKIWKILTSICPYYFSDSLDYFACFMDSLGAEWERVQLEPELRFQEMGKTEMSPTEAVIYLKLIPQDVRKEKTLRMPLLYVGIQSNIVAQNKFIPQKVFKINQINNSIANSQGGICHFIAPPGSNIKQLNKGRLSGNQQLNGDELSGNVLWALMSNNERVVVFQEHEEYSGRLDMLGYINADNDNLWDILIDTPYQILSQEQYSFKIKMDRSRSGATVAHRFPSQSISFIERATRPVCGGTQKPKKSM